MKKKYILSFLLIGFIFSLGVSVVICRKQDRAQPSFAIHQWSNLARVDELKALLRSFNIKTLVDTSCEEAQLVQQLDLPLDQYIGVDRRKDVIEAIRSSIGSAQRIYLVQDISRDLLPQADLILCWDALHMLPPTQIRSAITLFKKSNAKYLLGSHFPDLKKNQKSHQGTYRPINWTLPPYCFPEPIIQISEKQEKGQTKCLALWRIAELPN